MLADSIYIDDDFSKLSNGSRRSTARSAALITALTQAGANLNLQTLFAPAVAIVLLTMGRDVVIPETRLQWTLPAYSLNFGYFLLLWGRITVRGFVNPSVIDELVFNLFRRPQGLDAAISVPTAISLLGANFPPGKTQPYVFVAYGVGVPLRSVLGTI
ncbi:hypothetical protein CSPAE12_03271, partial [Colletotrichum incanum]